MRTVASNRRYVDVIWRQPLGIWALALFGALVLVACGSGGQSATGPPPLTGAARSDVQLRRGRRVFAAQCSRCHGVDGGGGLGPSFKGRVLLETFKTRADQVTFVRHGKGVMPAFGGILSRADIEAVVRYEREILTVQKP